MSGRLTRREALALGAKAAVLAAAAGAGGGLLRRLALRPARPPLEDALLVRGRGPDNLETPVAALDRLFTPNELFFVRTHDDPPAIVPAAWRLEIGGDAARPLSLSLADLGKRPQTTLAAALQCAGNGRAFFRPRVPGAQWERGACGQARWTGVRLADLLEEAGISADARHVHLAGADRMAIPAKTPPYLRSIPLERARHETTLVALAMNGEPLPWAHGGPARLVLPGWAGNNWVKWLTGVRAAKEEHPGFYMQSGYRLPNRPELPWCAAGGPEKVPVGENLVRAIIAQPADGAVLRAGAQEAAGVALSGMTHIVRVDVSTDGGASWQAAELEGEDAPGAWKVWRHRFRAGTPGPRTIMARATDARGAVQPEAAYSNAGGYLYNAIDRVSCEVRL